MSSDIFNPGAAHSLVNSMYTQDYGIVQGLVDPEFAAGLLTEVKVNGWYSQGGALEGREPGVRHVQNLLHNIHKAPKLAEFRQILNDTITEVSGFAWQHLTYLTVRVCPVREMSSRIHRNDTQAGPWLIALTLAGSGSINVYPQHVIKPGEEKTLTGYTHDPRPLASSRMTAGDAWGAYSGERSIPHAGGRNTSIDPKVLLLLYGWRARQHYPFSKSQVVDEELY